MGEVRTLACSTEEGQLYTTPTIFHNILFCMWKWPARFSLRVCIYPAQTLTCKLFLIITVIWFLQTQEKCKNTNVKSIVAQATARIERYYHTILSDSNVGQLVAILRTLSFES
jgi:hypothetical protein